MSKPGLKYFSGSFLLSLVAVFVAAKAYILLITTERSEQTETVVEARNIELFSVNEETDPIYEKFKTVSSAESPLDWGSSEIVADAVYNPSDYADDILYAPQTDDNLTLPAESDTTVSESADDDLVIADASEFVNESSETAKTTSDDDLQIADAADAPVFLIPLKHNYNIEGGTVTVSDKASDGQIALASHDVSIYNLGTQNQASVTDTLTEDESKLGAPTEDEEATEQVEAIENASDNNVTQVENDDPWDVAQVANKHVTKNSLSIKSETDEAEVALPAQEIQTAYRPQQNILIPIPDDIMNEENLTPQFSSSKENLQLEKELRAKNQLPAEGSSATSGASSTTGGAQSPSPKEVRPLPAQIPSVDDEKDFDDVNKSSSDEQTYRSLTDDITAWFTGGKSKSANTASKSGESAKDAASGSNNQQNADNKSQSRSIFQKLLGPQKVEKQIAPSELKITFQPNKAEISGQTLEWLRAFADNTLNNDSVSVEIRVSQSAPPVIQQKRLKLLYKVLADRGVEYHKINIIFTNREPNSFIIRNIRYASEEEMAKATVKLGDNPW